MKSFLCFTLLLAAALTVPAQNTPPPSAPVDPAVPEELRQYGPDRYDKIVRKSPFNFKIMRRSGAPSFSFAADLSLAGFTIDAGKRIQYASLVDKKTKTRIVINDQAPNKDGIQLVQLNRGPTLLASTVLARKGGENREIKADEQIVKRPAVVSPPVAPGSRQKAGPDRGGPPGPAAPDQQAPPIKRRVLLPPLTGG